jgi:hypothetical protein
MAEEVIALREYVDMRLAAIDGRLTERRTADIAALTLQAREYERRLETLNHAHEQAREKERDFLPREAYDAAHQNLMRRVEAVEAVEALHVDRDRLEGVVRQLEARIDALALRVADGERARANLDGRAQMLGAFLFGASIVINIGINLMVFLLGRR